MAMQRPAILTVRDTIARLRFHNCTTSEIRLWPESRRSFETFGPVISFVPAMLGQAQGLLEELLRDLSDFRHVIDLVFLQQVGIDHPANVPAREGQCDWLWHRIICRH
jgi:hypothetical protein